MSRKLPRKALIAVSSFNGAIYPGGHKTGVFFVEALHPYEVLTAAGFEVDLASETGTCGFDDVSLTPPFLSGSDHAILNNPKHPFMVKIKSQLKKASDLRKEDYGECRCLTVINQFGGAGCLISWACGFPAFWLRARRTSWTMPVRGGPTLWWLQTRPFVQLTQRLSSSTL